MGTVQDLYYWASDGDLDTLLLLQNYFSALYPSLNTGTEGTISIYDRKGVLLGVRDFSLPKDGCVKFRVSALLQDLSAMDRGTFGTLEVHSEIPNGVLDHIRSQKPYYFWDRFYQGNRVLFCRIGRKHALQMAPRSSFRRKPGPRNLGLPSTVCFCAETPPWIPPSAEGWE